VRSKQENVLWPQVMTNVRSADAFLLKGSPNPSPVQRVAAWIFGLTLFAEGFGIGFVGRRLPPVLLVGVAFALLGAWVFRNGFARREEP